MRDFPNKCVSCGRFFKYETGASWAQQWSYDRFGHPDLHDPEWQCKPCTEKHGPLGTNCAHPERYSGLLRLDQQAKEMNDEPR